MPGGNQRGRRLWALIAVLAITFAIVGSSTVAGAAQLSGRLVAAHLEQNNDQLDAYAFSLNGVRLVPATSATGDQMAQLNGATVTVTGTMSGGSLVVTGVAVAYSAALSTPPISSTSAPRKVAVIIAQYADSVPASAATARSIVFNGPDSLDSYLREVFARSTRVIGGRADVNNGDVFGPVVLSRPTNANRCSVDTVLDEVGVALMFAGHYFGYESSYYDNAMVFLPDQPCSLRGLGYTPGNLFATRDPSLAVVAHEFGHNLGLGHAGGRKCWNSAGKRVSLAGSSGRCTTYSYADPFDEMGNRQLAGQGNRQYNALHKVQLGALPANARVAATAGTPQYTIGFEEKPLGFPQLVEIPRRRLANGKVESFVVDYRAPYGHFDAWAPTDPVVNGITVRIHVSGLLQANEPDTVVVDATPGSRAGVDDFIDAPLAAGQSLHDPISGVTITANAFALVPRSSL
jgi:hypothetical protein